MVKYILVNYPFPSEYVDDGCKVVEVTSFPIGSISNGDVLYGDNESFTWGSKEKFPSWVSKNIPPATPDKRKIYDFFIKNMTMTEAYLVKVGTLANLRGTEEYNIQNANTGSRMMADIIGSQFVNIDGFDTLHPEWGKVSDKGMKRLFQKTTGETSNLFGKKNLAKNPSKHINFDVMFLYQTRSPLAFGFAFRDEVERYYEHSQIKTSIKLPFDIITFVVSPDRDLRTEDYIVDGLPTDPEEISYNILSKSIVHRK